MHTSVVHFVVVVSRIINQHTGAYNVACDLHNMRYTLRLNLLNRLSGERTRVRRRPSSDWNWALGFALDCRRASASVSVSLSVSASTELHSPLSAISAYTWYVYVINCTAAADMRIATPAAMPSGLLPLLFSSLQPSIDCLLHFCFPYVLHTKKSRGK